MRSLLPCDPATAAAAVKKHVRDRRDLTYDYVSEILRPGQFITNSDPDV